MYSRRAWGGALVLIALYGIVIPSFSSAAELSFTPATGTFNAGSEFSIKVSVDPKEDSVNASDGEVSFDPALVSVSSISKDGSVFSLWTSDPSFSNSAGTVSFSGGTPSAFSAKGTILTIKFKAKTKGDLKLSFTKGTVLAADGKGTDVFTGGIDGTYTIGEAAPAAPPPAADTETPTGGFLAGGDPPLPPVISSPTHPKSDAWYGTSTAQFSWKPPADAVSIRTTISQDENAAPKDVQKDVNEPQTVHDIPDGVSYFIAQYKNEFGWGESGKFMVQIDTAPPDEFDFELIQSADGSSPPQFAFEAHDALSGVDRYQIVFGTTIAATVRAQDVKDGTYPVPPQNGGMTLVTIRAFDKAGNMTEISHDIELPVVAKPNAKGVVEEQGPQSPWTSERIVLILFAFIIGALSTSLMYARKNVSRKKEQTLDRIAQISDRFDRVFQAMREEFEQMVNDFDAKPQLTPEERELLEHIKEVLDISEELVDTDMGELKRLIRG